MLEGFENFDFAQTASDAFEWCMAYATDPNTIMQLAITGGSFIAGYAAYKVLRIPAREAIDNADWPGRIKRIAHNLRKLLFPLLTIIILFVTTKIVGAEPISMNVSMLTAFIKVIFAWIFIRTIVQFIDNNAVRNVFATGIWAVAALSIFGQLEYATATLDSLGFTIGTFRLSALAVIKGGFYLFALLYFATFVSSFAERRVLKISGLTRSSQVLIAKIVRVVLIVVALLIGITSAGIDLSLFAVFGGAIGLGIGFGLQKGISNLFSGILLLTDRSIKPGDVIELENGTFGWVNNMAARYTEIVTRDNKSFLIPNEEFITQRVVNWSHGNSLIRLQVEFGVHYNSDPHEVKRLAEECIAEAHDRICKTPKPICHLTEFADSSLNFKLRFWIKDAEKGVTNIRGEAMLALWDAFKENNIEIPYPHREVYIHEAKSA